MSTEEELTLARAWELCLAQWELIKAHDYNCVTYYKRVFIEENCDAEEAPHANCFFCEYDKQHREMPDAVLFCCFSCPGRLVDPEFRCTTEAAHYLFHPEEFHTLLKMLYAKWLLTQRKEGSKNGNEKEKTETM